MNLKKQPVLKIWSLLCAFAMCLLFLFSAMQLPASADSSAPDGDGTAKNPYAISCFSDLMWLSQRVSQENHEFSVILTADISWDTESSWVPIGTHSLPFQGTFDGNGHKITGVSFQGNADQGLFGGNSGTVKNLGIEGTLIQGKRDTGAIAGWNSGTILNCYAVCDVLTTGNQCGGLVGNNSGTGKIENCYHIGSVTANEANAGGIVGRSSGDSAILQNCYHLGSVQVSSSPEYGNQIIGLVKESTIFPILNCFANRKMQRNQKLLSRTVLLLHSSLKPHQDKKNGQIGMCVTTRRAFPESETICQL